MSFFETRQRKRTPAQSGGKQPALPDADRAEAAPSERQAESPPEAHAAAPAKPAPPEVDQAEPRADAEPVLDISPAVPSGMRLRNTTLILPSILLLVDLLVLESAFLLVYWTRFLSGWFPTPKGIPDLGVYLLGSLGTLVVFVGLLYAGGMYDLRRRSGFADDITGVARTVLIATLLMSAAAFFYRGFSFSRTFVVGFALASYVLLLGGRLFSRYLHLIARSMGVGLERVAVVGRGPMQESVLRTLRQHPGLGMVVVGELLRPGDAPGSLPVLGPFDAIHDRVEEHQIDLLLVTLSFREVQQLLPILESLADSQVRVVLVPDLEDARASRLNLEHVENLPFMELRQVALAGIHRVFKRAFDIIVSGVLLLLTLPLLAAIALAVRFSSPGPVLFRQQRVGRDGTIFEMLKFRTMRQDAEQATGPVFAKADDPRRTRLGRWLRTYSLDELPQLYNVLRGDMSLVGPRPERPVFVQEFRNTIPRYFERHKVRSGITGWAQVNGLRGDTPLEARTRFDIHYVENWSLALDVKILFMTLRSVLSRRNAY